MLFPVTSFYNSMDDHFLKRKIIPECQDLAIVLMIDFKTGPWNIFRSGLVEPKTHGYEWWQCHCGELEPCEWLL
jgi:hypothetical protein